MIRYIIVCCLLVLLNKAEAKTIQVCKSCPVKTIRAGILAASANDVLIISKGIYKEYNLEIKKPVTIVSTENAVIDSDFKGNIFQIYSDNVTIQGLKLINVAQSYTKEFAAVLLFKANNFKILNNTLDKVFFGILVEKSKKGIIKGNTIRGEGKDEAGSGNGVHLWSCSDILVENNKISGMRDGIYLEFASDSRIINNNSENNIRYGLHFMFSNNDEYHYNTFNHNGAGVAVMFSKFINMTHNKFYNNWGPSSYGILLKEIYDAKIIENIFQENTTGIYLEGSTRVTYERNNFIKNGWAVKVVGSSYSNVFKENNFLHNSFDVSYNSKINENKFEGNYWSSYTGYDLNKDGIGDVPFRPVKLFSYIVNQTPETIVLLRSLFVDIINFSEKVSPVFTPDDLTDEKPLMKLRK
ncbi:MAG: nitrous oxide reductase family maturation protein NosD [Saprospiraceae bacterium]|nr:nitrous oxide reductase family maturation protein NosD [Saprospiraceae bacterium]